MIRSRALRRAAKRAWHASINAMVFRRDYELSARARKRADELDDMALAAERAELARGCCAVIELARVERSSVRGRA